VSGVSRPNVVVVQNAASDPLGTLAGWLESAGVGLQVRQPFAGDQIPSGLDGYSGLLVLGGPMGANDDVAAPWLSAVRRLLGEAVAGEVPTLGVCLGAQLLAVATGGRVGLNPDGPEFGAQLIAKRANASTDPLFGPLPITPDVIQWHFEAILALPPAAVLLANSPGCPVQAFRVGRLAWGIQFHIETTPDVVRAWAVEDADALEHYDVGRMLARADAAHDDIAEVWEPFVASWAGIVHDPSSVPAARRPRVSTAEPVTDPAAIRAALAAQMQSARLPPAQALPWPGSEPPQAP
jgi:GMP synthase (glutamine-hydrolysing)